MVFSMASSLAHRNADALARWVKDWLGEARTTLRTIATDPKLDPLGRALAAEGLRGDLEWLSVLIARLDGEPPPRPTAALEVQLERIHHELSPSAGPRSSTRPGRRAAARPMRAVAVGSPGAKGPQGALVVDHPGASPERLLAERLQLSRLQARVASLEPVEDDEGNPQWLGGDPDEWSEALSIRRIELADRAATQLQEMELAEARRPCERAAQTTQDEISEMIAFLEDMPLRRAVSRAGACPRGPGPAHHSSSAARRPLPTARGLTRPLLRRGSHATARTRSRKPRSRRCARRIGRQVRELQRLRRRVRGRVAGETAGAAARESARPAAGQGHRDRGALADPHSPGADRGGDAPGPHRAGSPTPTAPGSPGPTWQSARSCSPSSGSSLPSLPARVSISSATS